MSKVFEDYFSEIQTDMVSICLEYVEERAEKIYIYCSFEEGIVSSDYFYNINGKIVERHKLNDMLSSGENNYDVSVQRQSGVVKILNMDIKSVIKLCKEYNREMPTEMKLIYNIEENSLKAEYKYELVYSDDPVKTADDVAMAWFEEISKDNSWS
ncbi:DUF600 domain-containing protein [Sporosarcina sp. E16_8]|uniref:DUF600 domain-containing protein n=1 Tax=Sporosarcina sp. E16_8 TaxID=2789295 RepID=UPI001A916A17|nr:DUF600 domain-containing protein [Sporosarcina sp. E16_8]MBO0589751.1 DUF600 domain-containing protein [Sporosarcina sp. E16_8]